MVIKWNFVPYVLLALIASNWAVELEDKPIDASSKIQLENATTGLDKIISPSPTTNVTLNNLLEIKNLTTEAQTTTTTTSTTTTSTRIPVQNAVESEKGSSLSIFFVLCVIALGILLIHLMLQTHFQYLPESIVTVFLGAMIGLFLNFTSVKTVFEREEVFSPTAFFLVLLPPIIFEVS